MRTKANNQHMKTTMNNIRSNFLSKKRLLFTAFGVLSLAVAAAISIPLTNEDEELASLATAQVSRGSITETIDALGIVTAMPSASLTWQSSGIISDFELQVGDEVEKGEVLLTLEDSSISPEILQARTELLDTQVEYQKMLTANTDYLTALQEVNTQEIILENTYSMRHEFYDESESDSRIEGIYASYNQARAAVWELEDAYEQVKTLDDDNPIKIAAYEALQAGILKRDSLLRAMSQIMGIPYGQRTEGYFILYDKRRAELAQARATAQRLLDDSDELAAAQANLQALQNTVNQASIIAPFAGTITDIQAVAGCQASASDIAVQLDDLSNLIIEVGISQMEINKITAGQSALVTFDALPNAIYEGVVRNISEAGKTSGDDAIFKVVIFLLSADENVKPGFTASISIITSQLEDALLIPNQAVQYADDGSTYVLQQQESGQFTKVPIQTGARSDVYSELIEGDLEEGDALLITSAGNAYFQVETGEEVLREVRRINGGVPVNHK